MAGYSLTAGETWSVIDQDGAPLDTANFHLDAVSNPAALTVIVNGANQYEVVGVAAGGADVTFRRLVDQAPVTHNVTVAAPPLAAFDWQLGALVPPA